MRDRLLIKGFNSADRTIFYANTRVACRNNIKPLSSYICVHMRVLLYTTHTKNLFKNDTIEKNLGTTISYALPAALVSKKFKKKVFVEKIRLDL